MAKYEDFFVNIMVTEELGLQLPEDSPNIWKDAAAMFVSFSFFGCLPLLPYIFSLNSPDTIFERHAVYIISLAVTCLSLFFLGAVKSSFNMTNWFTSGMETLILGGDCALLAYTIGAFVETII